MSRNTKIKGRLPRLALGQQQNKPNTYPTIARTGDGIRTGRQPIGAYDDLKTTQIFHKNTMLIGGTGVPAGNNCLPFASTSLLVPGTYRAGVGDYFMFGCGNQSGTIAGTTSPFREESLFASDGKSNNQTFYSSGSNLTIESDFNTPLWSKTKIEINLTPSVPSSCQFINDTSKTNKPMMYWNNVKKTWEALGDGYTDRTRVRDDFLSVTQQILSGTPIGFGPGVGLAQGPDDQSIGNSAQPVVNFGFPFHGSYHPTGSHVVLASNWITQPFLVEKIVYEFSGSYQYAPITTDPAIDSTSGHAINTFFMLVQDRPYFDAPQITIEKANSADPPYSDISVFSVFSVFVL